MSVSKHPLRDYGALERAWLVCCIALPFAIFVVALVFALPSRGGIPGKIIDGDTLFVCDTSTCQKIRLCGINAPERSQAGGEEARAALSSMVAGQIVRCVQVDHGTVCDGRSRATDGDRMVAQCFVGDEDLAENLVRQGHACDWEKYSGGYYARQGGGHVCVDGQRASAD